METVLTSGQIDVLAACYDNAGTFGEVILGDEYTPDQDRIFEAVRDHPRVAVHSGHGVGKTRAAAVLVAWWINTRKPAKVVTTATTWEQVTNVLWPEIRLCYRRARVELVGRLMPRAPGIHLSDDHFAIGLSTNDDVAFQGKHSAHLLVIVDEAEGVGENIHRACGNLQPEKSFIIGNPVEPSGAFYDRCISSVWHNIRLDCTNHPNVIEGRQIIPGAVDRAWIEEQKELYGEGTPYYQARVHGFFPEQGTDTLIPLGWVESAMRNPVASPDAVVTISCDVARFGGNETVICVLEGQTQVEQICYTRVDTMETAGRIKAIHDGYRADTERQIIVDGDGIGGAVVDRLRELKIPVLSFRSGMKPKEDVKKWLGWKKREQFVNVRSAAWWALARALKDGQLSLKADDRLKAQLVGVKYRFISSGLIEVERKEQMVERLKKPSDSPDRADAIVMAWWARTRPRAGVEEKDDRRGRPVKNSRTEYDDIAGAPSGGWKW